MPHSYIEQALQQYNQRQETGSLLVVGTAALKPASCNRNLDTQASTGRTDGDTIRSRHDMADLAFRLSVLSRLASSQPKDWFDTSTELSNDDRIDILSDLRLNDSLPPQVSPAEIRKMIFAARTRQRTPRERLASIGSYVKVWQDDGEARNYAPSSFGPPDALFVQAFGRDSLTDDELPSVRELRSRHTTDVDTLDELIAMDFAPGPSNEALAKYIKTYTETAGVETIAQWEVAVALRQSDRDWYDRYSSAIHVLWPENSFYPTYDVTKDSIAKLAQRRLYFPIELAHGAMLARAEAIIRRQGIVADLPEHPLAVPYDPMSTQRWVHDRSSWWPRELATRVHHVLLDKVSF